MRFEHKYGWQLPMDLLGLGPRFSHIDIEGGAHVQISFKQPQRISLLGVPVSLRKLHLSPADPGGLAAAIQSSPS